MPLIPPPPTVVAGVSGTPGVGAQLQVTLGSWIAAAAAYVYQWQRSVNNGPWVDIIGEVRSDYIVTAGDIGARLSCLVTASNVAGASTPARSQVAGPVGGGVGIAPIPMWAVVGTGHR